MTIDDLIEDTPSYIIRRTPDADMATGIAATLDGTIIRVRASLWPTLTPKQQRTVIFLRQPSLSIRDLFASYLLR